MNGHSAYFLHPYHNFHIAKILLANNASVNIEGKDGWIPLSIAIARGDSQFVKILNQHKTKKDK